MPCKATAVVNQIHASALEDVAAQNAVTAVKDDAETKWYKKMERSLANDLKVLLSKKYNEN
jgi:hypothetical protein